MVRETKKTAKKKYKEWTTLREGIFENFGEKDDAALSAEIQRIFDSIDCNPKDGLIDKKELCAGIHLLLTNSKGVEVSDHQADLMMKDADLDGDGFIDVEEFASVIRAQLAYYKTSVCGQCVVS